VVKDDSLAKRINIDIGKKEEDGMIL